MKQFPRCVLGKFDNSLSCLRTFRSNPVLLAVRTRDKDFVRMMIMEKDKIGFMRD